MASRNPLKRKASSKKETKAIIQPEEWFNKTYSLDHYLDVFTALAIWGEDLGHKLESCIYPGSYIHVVPSLIFPETVYVDMFKGKQNHVEKFFSLENRPQLLKMLQPQSKVAAPNIRFHQVDLTAKESDGSLSLAKLEQPKDVLVSLSASGEIPITCFDLVRDGGFFVGNDDFGDASLAKGNPDMWTFIGAFEQDGLCTDNLAAYFVTSKSTTPDFTKNSGLSYSQRPFPCTKNAKAYLYQKNCLPQDQ